MLFRLHNLCTVFGILVVSLLLCTGWMPTTGSRGQVPESVRANPASYRPVYVPTYRGGGGGGSSGGGWSGGK
jgi:hypothetical protein